MCSNPCSNQLSVFKSAMKGPCWVALSLGPARSSWGWLWTKQTNRLALFDLGAGGKTKRYSRAQGVKLKRRDGRDKM
jgi:hypothetical protein